MRKVGVFMQIGFFPRYDRLGASSRYRFFMFFDRMQKDAANCSLSMHPGLSDKYIKTLYSRGRVGRLRKLREFMHMYLRAGNLPEKLIIEYELVPNLSFEREMRFIGKRDYILNFDDNVWTKYAGEPVLRNKYDLLCKNAAGVIVANHFLQEKVSLLNDNVILIPTVIELDKYRGKNIRKFDRFTLAWIGTPVTYMYLEQHLEALKLITQENDCELLVIADENLGKTRPLAGVRARYVNWSSDTECELLQRCHAGIMPLNDDEFSRGKSAFKLLQYQAAGLPLLASPVGENNSVIADGVNGFLCQSAGQWNNAVKELVNDHELYTHCCKNSQQRAWEYSLEKYYPVYCSFIEKSFGVKLKDGIE